MGDLGKAMIPSKWSGAGTWFDLKGNMKTINMCNQSQHFFWRVMLTVPGGMSKHCSEVRDGYVGNEVERKNYAVGENKDLYLPGRYTRRARLGFGQDWEMK